jgi:hypothetical protein
MDGGDNDGPSFLPSAYVHHSEAPHIYHVVITINVCVNRVARQLEESIGNRPEGGSVSA